ncbi:hypothetical protein MASR1M101_39120 [Gemmatimonas sp.]
MKWVDGEGAPCEREQVRGLPHRFHLPTFIAWWTERTRRKAMESATVLVMDKRREAAEVELLELKVQRERGETIRLAHARAVVRSLHTQQAMLLRQMPRKWAHRFVRLESLADAVSTLETVVAEQLRAFQAPSSWAPVLSMTELRLSQAEEARSQDAEAL